MVRNLARPTIALRLFAKILFFALISSVLFPLFLPVEQVYADRVAVTVVIDRVQEIVDPDPGPGPGNYFVKVRIGSFTAESSRPSIASPDFSPAATPGWTFSKVVERGFTPIRISLIDEDDNPWTDDVMDISGIDRKLHVDLTLDSNTGRISSPDRVTVTPSSPSPPMPGFGTNPPSSFSVVSTGDDDRDPDAELRAQMNTLFGTEQGGEPARITFSVTFSPSSPPRTAAIPSVERMPNNLCNSPETGGLPISRDTDGDSIPDRVELCGLDANGIRIFDTRALRPDPCRKTILVELDYMRNPASGISYRPSPEAITKLINAFKEAPIHAVNTWECPYSRYGFPAVPTDNPRIPSAGPNVPFPHNTYGGVQLIIDLNSPRSTIDLPNRAVTVSDFKGFMSQSQIFQQERGPYFHYGLVVNSISGSSTGLHATPEDFMVIVRPQIQNSQQQADIRMRQAEIDQQAARMMHEIGHTLGLQHGGNQGANYDCKPNYLSVMSTTFSSIGGIPSFPTEGGMLYYKLDYSAEALRDLNERALSESVGIQDGREHMTVWGYPGPGTTPLLSRPWVGPAQGSLDWNLQPDPESITRENPMGNPISWTRTVEADINNLSIAGCGPSPRQQNLAGYDDWANLDYRINRNVPGFVPQSGPKTEDADRLRQEVDAYFNLQPKISISSSVPDNNNSTGQGVLPGQTITYTATVENLGKLPARQVEIVNVFPDGTNQTRTILDIEPGGSVIELFNYTVPQKMIEPIVLNNTVAFTDEMSPRIPKQYKENSEALAATISMPVNVNMATTDEDLLVAQDVTSNQTSEAQPSQQGDGFFGGDGAGGEDIAPQSPNISDTTPGTTTETAPENATSGVVQPEVQTETEPVTPATPGHWWDTEITPPQAEEGTSFPANSTSEQAAPNSTTTSPQEANMTDTTVLNDTQEELIEEGGAAGFFGQE